MWKTHGTGTCCSSRKRLEKSVYFSIQNVVQYFNFSIWVFIRSLLPPSKSQWLVAIRRRQHLHLLEVAWLSVQKPFAGKNPTPKTAQVLKVSWTSPENGFREIPTDLGTVGFDLATRRVVLRTIYFFRHETWKTGNQPQSKKVMPTVCKKPKLAQAQIVENDFFFDKLDWIWPW